MCTGGNIRLPGIALCISLALAMDENFPPPPLPPNPAVPPLPPPPPVIVSSVPPNPPRRSRGWMIAAIIFLVLLVISGFLNVVGMFTASLTPGRVGHSRTTGPRLEEVVNEDNDASDKIAV